MIASTVEKFAVSPRERRSTGVVDCESVKGAGLDKKEGRNFSEEAVSGLEVHHFIGAAHLSGRRAQRAKALVSEFFAGAKARLLPNDSWTFHFLNSTSSIGDHPMSIDELHGMVAHIADANLVGEQIFVLRWRALLGYKSGHNLDSDASSFCDF